MNTLPSWWGKVAIQWWGTKKLPPARPSQEGVSLLWYNSTHDNSFRRGCWGVSGQRRHPAAPWAVYVSSLIAIPHDNGNSCRPASLLHENANRSLLNESTI